MLGTTTWFAIVIALVSTALLETSASLGRAALHEAADRALEPALNDAIADYQNALRSARSGGVMPDTIEQTIAPDASDAGARFTLAYAVVPTTISAPACASAGDVSGSDAVGWLQCGDAVRESRLSLHVTARVLDARGGAVLARREEYVTLRLFAEPPFSALVGRRDGAALDPAGRAASAPPAHEGDLGGGTPIHLRYECRDGTGRCSGAMPPDPDAALRANVPWQNGNAVAP